MSQKHGAFAFLFGGKHSSCDGNAFDAQFLLQKKLQHTPGQIGRLVAEDECPWMARGRSAGNGMCTDASKGFHKRFARCFLMTLQKESSINPKLVRLGMVHGVHCHILMMGLRWLLLGGHHHTLTSPDCGLSCLPILILISILLLKEREVGVCVPETG